MLQEPGASAYDLHFHCFGFPVRRYFRLELEWYAR